MAIAGRLAAREPSARTPTANSTRNPGSSFTFSTVQGGVDSPTANCSQDDSATDDATEESTYEQ